MNRVKRAIIMAAGIGKRMRPLTMEIPKPLVKVNGKRMIDTIIEALYQNGITEIYVVVGYLKDQFYEWADGFNGIIIIENPYYDSCNNISSLYVARQHIEEAIIIDGDQIIRNPAILNPDFNLSGYNAVWCSGHTDEWLMKVDAGIVTACSRNGGECGWQLYSISRWSKEDGKKLKKHLEREFENGNKQIYWDDVPMFCYFNKYKLGIMEMKKDDVLEIDDLVELSSVDESYAKFIAD